MTGIEALNFYNEFATLCIKRIQVDATVPGLSGKAEFAVEIIPKDIANNEFELPMMNSMANIWMVAQPLMDGP